MKGILLESHLAYLSGRTYVLSLFLRLSPASTLLPRFIPWQLGAPKLYLGPHRRRHFLLQRQLYPCASPLDRLALWYAAPVSLSFSTHLIFNFFSRALSLGIHFHHPPVAAARLQPWWSTSRKYARTPPASIWTRSRTRYVAHLLRTSSGHRLTGSSGRRIGV